MILHDKLTQGKLWNLIEPCFLVDETKARYIGTRHYVRIIGVSGGNPMSEEFSKYQFVFRKHNLPEETAYAEIPDDSFTIDGRDVIITGEYEITFPLSQDENSMLISLLKEGEDEHRNK